MAAPEVQSTVWCGGQFPGSFAEFVEHHGADAIMPDFGPVAHQLVDALDGLRRIPVIEMPQGVGKTSQLLPAIELACQQQGRQFVGSLGSLGWYGEKLVQLNPHSGLFITKPVNSESGQIYFPTMYPDNSYFPDGQNELVMGRAGRAKEQARSGYLSSDIRQVFETAEPGAVLAIDELTGLLKSYPRLMKALGGLASDYQVELVGLEVDVSSRCDQGSLANGADVGQAKALTGRDVARIDAPIPLVPMSAVGRIIKDFRLDLEFAERFASNPDTRRLRVVEMFVQALALRNRYSDEWDNPIFSPDQVFTAQVFGQISELSSYRSTDLFISETGVISRSENECFTFGRYFEYGLSYERLVAVEACLTKDAKSIQDC